MSQAASILQTSEKKQEVKKGSAENRSFSSLIMSPKVLTDSIIRLSPISLLSNPVMLIVEITFFIVTAMAIDPQLFYPVANVSERVFYVEVAAILLITVWFSTLSDSLAETQARMTANSLRTLETEVMSKKIMENADGSRVMLQVPSNELHKGDLIFIEKNDIVPIDADVLQGIAMLDESLLTGESTPVRKAPGDQLIGGSKVISDSLTARVSVNPGRDLHQSNDQARRVFQTTQNSE